MSCERPAAPKSATGGEGHSSFPEARKKGVAFPVFARSTSFKLRDDPHRPISGEPMSGYSCALSLSCVSFSPVLPLAPRPRRLRQSLPRPPPSRSTPRPNSRTICEGRTGVHTPGGLVHAPDLVAGPKDASQDAIRCSAWSRPRRNLDRQPCASDWLRATEPLSSQVARGLTRNSPFVQTEHQAYPTTTRFISCGSRTSVVG